MDISRKINAEDGLSYAFQSCDNATSDGLKNASFCFLKALLIEIAHHSIKHGILKHSIENWKNYLMFVNALKSCNLPPSHFEYPFTKIYSQISWSNRTKPIVLQKKKTSFSLHLKLLRQCLYHPCKWRLAKMRKTGTEKLKSCETKKKRPARKEFICHCPTPCEIFYHHWQYPKLISSRPWCKKCERRNGQKPSFPSCIRY